MGQTLQFVPNNGGSKGSEGPKWIKFSNSCEQWGVKGVGGAKMGQILQFVLNNGGGGGGGGGGLKTKNRPNSTIGV